MPRPWYTLLLLLLLLLPATAFGQNEPRVFTYSYSNLFDGNFPRSPDLTTYEMVQAIEESFTLWSQVVPLSFVELPDSGPPPTDDQYLAQQHPIIRIGYHPITKSDTLAHAFPPGPGGLESDLHFDSSSRTWDERFFLTTALHELGHTIGLNHIHGETAILNESIGGPNLLPGVGQGFLFQPDIDEAQRRWGAGSGTVTTTRTWVGLESNAWEPHANWKEGFRPTKNTVVRIESDGAVRVASDEVVRSVNMGGGTNALRVARAGSLDVKGNVELGTRDGGNAIVPEGASVRTFIPQDASIHDTWFTTDFDDRQWAEGTTGIGFERSTGFEEFIGTDLESLMYDQNASVYSRIEFNVDDPSKLDFLRLKMRYDDGFVAYVNGVEVASANRPNTLRWNGRATGLHSDDDAVQYVDFEIDAGLSSLQAGRNVLAIQGLNYTANSSDMLISPAILGGEIQQELIVDGPMTVGGDLVLAQNAGSVSRVTVGDGTLIVRGDVTVGEGQSTIEMRGGVLQVQGDSTPAVAVASGAIAQTLVPTDDSLENNWTAKDFNDSAWNAGPTGLGFEQNEGFDDLIATDLSDDLYQKNASFYARIPFDADSVSKIGEMMLAMQFDDGFVAYLNGTEIARANAPNQPRWNSRATRGVDDREAREPVQFDVSEHVGLLSDGTNVLAIQGLNQSPTSTDLLLIPELSYRELAGTLNVDQLNFFGGQLRDIVRINGQFNHQEGMFSPSRPGSNGADPGSIEINGPYQMTQDAVLEMHVDGMRDGEHDVLSLLDDSTLDGTLSVVINANGGNYVDPSQPGETHQIDLVVGDKIEGQFASLRYDGEALEGHHGGGLFRRINYGDQAISLVNYQAFAGDANGDGFFNSSDFIEAFRAGEYEDSIAANSDWTEGDWNGDMEFQSNDLILALQTGRYEQNDAPAAAIPEPCSQTLLLLAAVLVAWRRRKR